MSKNLSDLRLKKMLISTMPLLVFQKYRSRNYQSPTSFDIDPEIGPLKLFSPRVKLPSLEGEERFPISRGPLKSFLSKLRWVNEGRIKRDVGIDQENKFPLISKSSSLES